MCFFLFYSLTGFAQLDIYNYNTTLIIGTWDEFGNLTETESGTPIEGTNHYQFIYNYSANWSGIVQAENANSEVLNIGGQVKMINVVLIKE